MRARAVFVALMLATVAVAGCFGDGGEDAGPTGADDPVEDPRNETEANETDDLEDAGPEITSSWKNATWEGASVPGDGYYCHPIINVEGGCENYHEFSVAAGSSTVVGEIAWNTENEMYFRVLNASGATVAETTGATPLQLIVEEDLPEDGSADWMLEAWIDADTPTEVEATFVSSVVASGQAPADFARLDE